MAAVSADLSGVRCWCQAAEAMTAPHCHDDIEVVVVVGDEPAFYEHGGGLVGLLPGRVTVFWAVYPHTLDRKSSGAVLRRLMLPSQLFLSRHLPERLVLDLLSGRVLSAEAGDAALEQRFGQWERDLHAGNWHSRLAMMLEVEAWLRRIAPALIGCSSGETVPGVATVANDVPLVASMCRYIIEHLRDPIRVEDVAKAAALGPRYAMEKFRRATGSTIAEYVTRCRVFEAQRLLVETAANVSDVGFAAGFGSVSQFYEHFTSKCGQTPLQYRKTALTS